MEIDKFEERILEEYSKEVKNRSLNCVPIVGIKNSIGVDTKQFKTLLFSMIERRYDKLIILHETGIRSKGGITNYGHYYHFITIRDK